MQSNGESSLENGENLITTAEKEDRYYNMLSKNMIQLFISIKQRRHKQPVHNQYTEVLRQLDKDLTIVTSSWFSTVKRAGNYSSTE